MLMDAENEAQKLIERICSDHALVSPPQINIQGITSWKIPIQTGLKFDIEISLTDDIFHIKFESFWGEFFPFPENKQRVADILQGILSGNIVANEYARFGNQVKYELIQSTDGSNERLYSYYPRPIIPFLPSKLSRIISNKNFDEETQT